MAKKELAQIDIQKAQAMSSVDTGFIGFGAKNDGLYEKHAELEYKLLSTKDFNYIPEDEDNKVTEFQIEPDHTHYPSEKLVKDELDKKQDKNLISNIYYISTFQGLLDAWADLQNSDLPNIIYASGTITFTQNVNFTGTKRVHIIGTPVVSLDLNGFNFTITQPNISNVAFFNPNPDGYLRLNNGYGTFDNVYFYSDKVDASQGGTPIPHFVTVGSVINNTVQIQINGISHQSDNYMENASNLIQPIWIKCSQTQAIQNFLVVLRNVNAGLDYSRFSNFLITSDISTNFRVTGDGSWKYHPTQLSAGQGFIGANSTLDKVWFVDNLRTDRTLTDTSSNKTFSINNDGKVGISLKSIVRLPNKSDLIGNVWTNLKINPEVNTLVAIFNDGVNNGFYYYKGNDFTLLENWVKFGSDINFDDIDTHLGINRINGSSTKFLNEQGNMVEVQGGSGGTTNYSDLTNKPSINNITLEGNKTSQDLSLISNQDLADFANSLTPESIGAEPERGSNDYYVTSTEKTLLNNTSGINSGDQDIDGELGINRTTGATTEFLNKKGEWVEIEGTADLGVVTKEPTGFRYPAEIQVNYDWLNRRVILTANSGFTLECWYQGLQIPEFKDQTTWTSPIHADVSGSYFLHYCDGLFKFTTTPWFFDCVQIAFCQYKINNNGHYIGIRETHGLTMDYATHKHLHNNVGTYLVSGADLSSFTLNSSTDTNRRPLISATVVNDEDLESTINALSSKLYTRRYITNIGASVFRAFDVDQTEIVKTSGAFPVINSFNGTDWVDVTMVNNRWAVIFVIAVPVTSDSESQKFRYMWVQPQAQYTTEAAANAITSNDVVLGDSSVLVSEFVFVSKVTIRTTGNNWQISKVEKLSGNKSSQTSTPSGNYLSVVTATDKFTGDGSAVSPLDIDQSKLTVKLPKLGFQNLDATLSIVHSTRVFTITGAHTYYVNDVEVVKGTTSTTLANVAGVHYVFYNSSNVLTSNTTGFEGTQVAIVVRSTVSTITDQRLPVGYRPSSYNGDFAEEFVTTTGTATIALKKSTVTALGKTPESGTAYTPLDNTNVITIALPQPTAGFNQSVLYFETGATLPTINQPANTVVFGSFILSSLTRFKLVYDRIHIGAGVYRTTLNFDKI